MPNRVAEHYRKYRPRPPPLPLPAADARHVRIREITAEINRLATELTSLT
jgi:hypothetical protein